jgi:glycosyltransferase involved in cell wall biosynthesis
MKLSILICHLPKRKEYLERLLAILRPQLSNKIEVLIDHSEPDTIGEKRNRLLKEAQGRYLAFIDDDDMVSPDYIRLLMEGINKGADCCSLTGEITTDGTNSKTFIHSIKYNSYFEKDGIYYRPPNHLNCIKSSIAKLFPFPEKNHGEDTSWAMNICRSGILKIEHWIGETLYHYDYKTNK